MISDFIRKLQNKPENIKKRILWITIIIVGLAFFLLWITNVKKSFERFNKEKFIEEFNFPVFQENLRDIPPIEILQISEEELKKMEEEINKEEEKEIQNQNNK